MKTTINIKKLTKKTLIEYTNNIILMYNKFAGVRKFAGNRIYSVNTLNNKSREFIEELFEKEWNWLREEIRYHYACKSKLPEIINIAALDMVETETNNMLNKSQDSFEIKVNVRNIALCDAIHNFISNVGLLDDGMEISIDDIHVHICSPETISISLTNHQCEISYYHLHHTNSTYVDKINFGTIGGFDLDSSTGIKQLILMGIISHIGSNMDIRTEINHVLDELYEAKSLLNKEEFEINKKLVDSIDNIVAPFIDGVAMGKIQ